MSWHSRAHPFQGVLPRERGLNVQHRNQVGGQFSGADIGTLAASSAFFHRLGVFDAIGLFTDFGFVAFEARDVDAFA